MSVAIFDLPHSVNLPKPLRKVSFERSGNYSERPRHAEEIPHALQIIGIKYNILHIIIKISSYRN